MALRNYGLKLTHIIPSYIRIQNHAKFDQMLAIYVDKFECCNAFYTLYNNTMLSQAVFEIMFLINITNTKVIKRKVVVIS